MGYCFKNIDISRYLFIIFIPVHNITSNDEFKKIFGHRYTLRKINTT